MKLQAKLTLGFVLLATLMVGFLSAMDLVNNMQPRFDDTLLRADMISKWASKFVTETLNSQRAKPVDEALLDPALTANLVELMTNSHAILEIAVVSPDSKEVLADSQPLRLGEKSEAYPDFRALVQKAGWYKKFKVLFGNDNYQLEQRLGAESNPVVLLRVVVAPAFIRTEIYPALQQNARVAIVSVVAAIGITFLFSALAFQPLGRLARQLDLVAQGEYASEKISAAKPAGDEVAIMSSKVSLLGQRLRGAQYEVSDLRGNLDRLLQDLEDAVFIFNRQGRLVFASGSVEKFLGRRRSDLTGEPIASIFPPSTTLGELVAGAAETRRSIRNQRVPLEVAGTGKGPTVVIFSVEILDALPDGQDRGSGVLVRLRDPEAQRQLGRELQTADRLAAISRVTSGVAHEVKNPLNAILLHVEVAKAKLARGDTEVVPQMEIIGREILRLDRVVKTFLDFTRPVELKLTQTALHDLIGELVELARPQAAAAGICVQVDQEATEGIDVRVDRDLLKQAMLNVVVNAIEAMPKGGELRFQTLTSDHTAEIRISDTGPGIPPELRDKIFRLYFTTRKEGSGIGLAMTFRIVQLHNGAIDFTSEPGKGATFFIRLPIVT